jgi:hypothetical protein
MKKACSQRYQFGKAARAVFTLPAAIADITYQNKAVIYDLLLKTSAETTLRRRGSRPRSEYT